MEIGEADNVWAVVCEGIVEVAGVRYGGTHSHTHTLAGAPLYTLKFNFYAVNCQARFVC